MAAPPARRSWSPLVASLVLASLLPSVAGQTPTLRIQYIQTYMYHFLVSVQLSSDGYVYLGALRNTAGTTYTPSVYQMSTGSGLDGYGKAAVLRNVVTNIVVSGLLPGKRYDLYGYAVDSNANDIGLAGIAASKRSSLYTATGGDYTTPTIAYVSPFAVTDENSIQVSFQLSKDGNVWTVALQNYGNGTVMPLPPAIKGNVLVDSWGTTSVAASGNYKGTITLTNLVADTTYDLYTFAVDMSGNGIDGTPAYVQNLSAVAATKLSLRTLARYRASQFSITTSSSGTTQYHVEPATWNTELPRSYTSGCTVQRKLESWNTEVALKGALLSSPQGQLAFACGAIPTAPRSAVPYLVMVKRGMCTFRDKAVNAQRAGYSGMLVIDFQNETLSGTLPDITVSGSAAGIDIPAWLIGLSAGNTIANANVVGLVTANIKDMYRKPLLGPGQRDEFGNRVYITK